MCEGGTWYGERVGLEMGGEACLKQEQDSHLGLGSGTEGPSSVCSLGCITKVACDTYTWQHKTGDGKEKLITY